MSLEGKIEKIVDVLVRKNNCLGRIIKILRSIGFTRLVRKIWIRTIYFRESLFPTNEMLESRVFFETHKKDVKLIISSLADEKSKDVYKKVIQFRCTHKIKFFPEYNMNDQYFVKEIVPKSEGYFFADCGAYIGDTAKSFIDFCDGNYKKIVCFEPDPLNLKALYKFSEDYDNIDIIPKGLWDEPTTLSFSLNQTASRISNVGDYKIEVTGIDHEEKCQNVNFIKMDIEGAEIKALNGAKDIIKKNHPILAICIYHSNEDMINIINWVKELNMGYAIYVRHHSFDINETVMYAIPQI